MPKILIYNDWIFIIYATDVNENRMHVHVGKRSIIELCKIWLEPKVEIANPGELTKRQQNEVLEIAKQYKSDLIQQWIVFMSGKNINIIKGK